MWDDDKDRELMRNQMLAITLMGVLMFVWFAFFMPKEPPVQRPDGSAPAETAASAPAPVGTSPSVPARGGADASAESGAWSIPAAEPAADPADDEITLVNDHLGLTFTRVGARLKRAHVFTDTGDSWTVQLVPEGPAEGDTAAVYPLGLEFSDPEIGQAFDYARFDVERQSESEVVFRLDLPGGVLRKRFGFVDREHVLSVDIQYTASRATQFGASQTPAYRLLYGPGMVIDGEGTYFRPELIWHNGQVTETLPPNELPRDESGMPRYRRIPGINWIGYHGIYFLTALRPVGVETPLDGGAIGDDGRFAYGFAVPEFSLDAGATHATSFECYIGPMHQGSLREAWPTLGSALRFFGPGRWYIIPASFIDLMDWFAKILLQNLNWWHSFIPNYGIAIILLTVVVRSVMFPLTLKQIRTGKRMRELQPEMKELQERYKDNREELGKAMMLLYKERKINPLSGCFPLLLQMPVFIALYRMIWKSYELRGAEFLWIKDLSQPDAFLNTPFLASLPLVGQYLEHVHLLPFLVTGAMILSMRMMPQSPASSPEQEAVQKTMMRIMPIMFGMFSWIFSAGLNLYVLVSTILGIVQNQLVRTSGINEPVPAAASATGDGAKPAPAVAKKKETKDAKQRLEELKKKRKQHFYRRAQQQKREQTRAAKRNKKR